MKSRLGALPVFDLDQCVITILPLSSRCNEEIEMAAKDNKGIRVYDEFFDALGAALKSADASERATLKKALEARIGDFPIDHPLLYRFFFSISSACSPFATRSEIEIIDPNKPEGSA